jgi:AcrR family transcriptional regulator
MSEIFSKIVAQATSTLRREPLQKRGQETIDKIFKVTVQIMEAEGDASLNTRKIAEKAGFSVGRLYQYFPSKEAILLAMNEQLRSVMLARLDILLTEAEKNPNQNLEELVRAYIRVMTEMMVTGNKARRAIVGFGWRYMDQNSITVAAQAVSDRINLTASRMQSLVIRPTNPWIMFVLTRAVLGVLRSAAMEKSVLAESPQFQDELGRLALGMLSINSIEK